MPSIFANAVLTIVAAQGSNANYGLRGLRGIPQPWQLCQEKYRIPGRQIVLRHIPGENRALGDHLWHRRGWTLQEQLFSARQIIFEADSVCWACTRDVWHEDECEELFQTYVHESLLRDDQEIRKNLFLSAYPFLPSYTLLLFDYNARALTYPEDVLDAASGTLSLLGRSFHGGFLYGLPVLFFDVALLWKLTEGKGVEGRMRRRTPTNSKDQLNPIPSWS